MNILIRCSFCGLSQYETKKMLTGVDGAAICEACVVTAAEMIGRPCSESRTTSPSSDEPG